MKMKNGTKAEDMIYCLKTKESHLDKTLGRTAERMGEETWNYKTRGGEFSE